MLIVVDGAVFKNSSLLPHITLHSYDVRGRPLTKALYWSDTNSFGPRAYFVTVSKPAALSVDNVQLDDEGVSYVPVFIGSHCRSVSVQ